MSSGRKYERRNVAVLVSMMMLLGSSLFLAVPASANHPEGSCLDVAPETFNRPTGDTHTLTATLRVESNTECTATAFPGTTGAVKVNFEVETGPTITVQKDDTAPPPRQVVPADSNPSTRDMSCTITMGAQSNSCQVEFTSQQSGNNRIRAWIDGETADETEGRNEVTSPGGAEPDNTDVVEVNWQGRDPRLNCEPENDSNPTGSPHTVSCRVTDQNGAGVPGQKVDAEATGAGDPDNQNGGSPDFTCTTDNDGNCSFTHTSNQAGVTTYRAFVDDDADDNNLNEGSTTEGPSDDSTNTNDTDVVQKTWFLPPLDCEPETDINPAGTTHTITCNARNGDGSPRVGVQIDAEATGENDPDDANGNTNQAEGDTRTSPDFSCVTDSNGNCSIVHGPGSNAPTTRTRTTNAGRTEYRAWVDEDRNDATVEADSSEGVSESAEPGAKLEPDNTDVVEKRWGASRLDCTPEIDTNPTGLQHSITCRATDEARDPGVNPGNVAGAAIDVEAIGANDPDASNTPATPDFSCTTTGLGTCTITHGAGGVGTTNNQGVTTYRAWIDLDNNNNTQELDVDETQEEGTDTSEPDNTDTVIKNWIGSRLDCSPESDTNPAESSHTITCTSRDESGATVPTLNIDVEATGANDPDNGDTPKSPDFTCTTNDTGTCSFTHGPGGRGTTTALGKTTYRAWIDGDNDDATAEADPTETRDEGTTPSPTSTPSPSGSPSSSASPSPSGSPSSGASPSPSGSPSSSASPSPSGSPSSGTSPSPGATPSPSPSAGNEVEPDGTDVVEKNWTAVPDRITMTPETDSAKIGSCNPFTVTAVDTAGKPVAGVVIDVEQRHERSGNTTAGDEPDVSFCVPEDSEGSNPSDVDEGRGDLNETPDDRGTAGGETDRATDANGQVTFGIRVSSTSSASGAGEALVTAFFETEDNDDPDPADTQDSSRKTWLEPVGRSVDCSPETAKNPVGTTHTVTCTVLDAQGRPAEGEGVTFSESGPGRFTSGEQQDTDANGQVSATVTSQEVGKQEITATLTADLQGEPDTDECDRGAGEPAGSQPGNCQDSVSKVWVEDQLLSRGPCAGFAPGTRNDVDGDGDADVIVGRQRDDRIRGTAENDLICGLGGDDEIDGRGGSDRIFGNGGSDVVTAGAGKDRVTGGAGGDVVAGEGGNDRLNGSRGRDRLRGGSGSDDLKGGANDDVLDGGRGTDSCDGGSGSDRLRRCE